MARLVRLFIAHVCVIACCAAEAADTDHVRTFKPLKITSLEIRTLQPLSFLYLRTADGHEGIGQMGRSQMDSVHGDDDLVASMFMRHVAPLALGADVSTPAALEKLESDILYANYKNTGQFLARAISGLDTAAWDLLSKAQNRSVCQMAAQELGQDPEKSCVGRILPMYCTNLTRDISKEALVDLIEKLHKRFGARTYKIKIAQTMGRNKDIWPNRTLDVIPYVRSEVDRRLGVGISLAADANGGYEDTAHAAPIAELMKANDYEWFEEPVPFWNYAGTKQVRDLGLVKIAAGENEFRFEEFEMVLKDRVVDIVQPDFGYVGGFTNAMRVAKLAASKGVVVEPHSPDLSMTEFFSTHLLGAVPNPGKALEYGCTDESTPTDVFVSGLHIVNGTVEVPKGPGWGVHVRPSWLERSSSMIYPPTEEFQI